MSSVIIAPPTLPWKEVNRKKGAVGSLSFYYNDDLASLPVRAITKAGDNKADPNIETLTYGLFSTCQKGMRSAFVKEGREHLFFFSNFQGVRSIAGYYSIKWFAPIVSAGVGDYALAAEAAHFISDPIAFSEVDKQCQTNISRRFRTSLNITEEEAKRVLHYMKQRPSAHSEYLAEIDRLERYNILSSGRRYVERKSNDPYTWQSAVPILQPSSNLHAKSDGKKVLNSSVSGWWVCDACGETVKNKALLRTCPNASCGVSGTLRPLLIAPSA